jgi:protein involved in polysaccharide export with SLBB domain
MRQALDEFLLPAILIFVAALALLSGSLAAQAADPDGEYKLGSGDRVRVAVFGEPDLSVSERVSDRGTIAYPLLGELAVGDLTPGELERLVTERLKGPYLVDPKVTVSVDEFRQVFVMGQVHSPGGYPYVPGLTVRKAVSIAGGFTDRASRGKIYLVPEKHPDDERRVGEDAAVGPGDTVVVRESFF